MKLINKILDKMNYILLKVRKYVYLKYVLFVEHIRMRLAIRMAKDNHKKALDAFVCERKSKNYVVLLDLPRRRFGRIRTREFLYPINNKNFKRIRQKGWLPKDMDIYELKRKAFYVSDMRRSYVEEKQRVDYAWKKYKVYLEKKLS